MQIKTILDVFLTALRQDKLFLLLIVGLGLLLPLTPPFFLGVGKYWDNYKLILMAIIPVLGFSYLVLQEKKQLTLNRSDLAWFLFLLMCFTSYTWATNGSLVWYLGFGWLGLVLWMLLIRLIVQEEKLANYLNNILLLIGLAIFLHFAVVYFAGQLTKFERWNSHFGYNGNYTSIYLLAIYPFILFYNNQGYLIKILKVLCTGLIIIVLYKSSARGSFLAFLLLVSFWLKCNLPEKYFRWLVGIGVLSLCVLLGIYFEQINDVWVKIKDVGGSQRLYMYKSSFSMFLESPFIGQGLGNWYLEAYKTDLVNVSGFNRPLYYCRLGSHNLYEQIITELGAIGIISFLFPLSILILKGWLNSDKLSNLQKSGYGCLLVYLVGSFFYKDANIYESHFSSLQLLGFISIGILKFKNQSILKVRWLKFLLLSAAISVLVWFVYFYKMDLKFSQAKPYYNCWTNAELMDIFIDKSFYETKFYREPSKVIQILEDIYHPVFKTTHGFYAGRLGPNKSLELHLAYIYQQQQDFKKAEFYYKKALKKAPYDEELLRKYARYLLRVKQDAEEATIYAQRAYNIQSNNFNNCLQMAEIYIYLRQYDEARKVLQFIGGKRWYPYEVLKFLFLARIAKEEKKYKEAREYIEKIKKGGNKLYEKEVNNLIQQLEQATKKTVK